MDSTFLVLEPGSFTTVQDAGRRGYQKLGVPLSGAADEYAFRVANLLAGNRPNAAVLEMTVVGCTLATLKPAWVAVTGAEAEVKKNSAKKTTWSGFAVEPGDVLRMDKVRKGCRLYLGVSGGIDVPEVMASRSTSAQAGFGGYKGRALRKGDFLSTGGQSRSAQVHSEVPREFVPELSSKMVLRCLPGPQAEFFHSRGEELFASEYRVTTQADKRGIRLEGPPLEHASDSPGGVLSEPSLPGNIQVPGDGSPIVLLREQTVGGYAKVATVITSDLWRLGQAAPGDRIRFRAVDRETAASLRVEMLRRLEELERRLQEE
ncbi:MAG: biotin-dependent carboxyltransferase family protein [Desulfohalobiaceae bacterium]|nr:biotin-dependent carboxyltransferase family protein [Desulfohalobiaceae bacterium]